MCGRFTLTLDADEIIDEFELTDFPDLTWNRRFNIAPSQQVLTIHKPASAKWMRWGINRAVNDRNDIMINIRKETLIEKNYFKNMFDAQRCIIPMDGFFEWKKSKNKSYPFYFKLKDKAAVGFAGLWKPAAEDASWVECAIITCPANELVGSVHHRMPVMLDKAFFNTWLNKETNRATLLHLLQPYASDKMTSFEVSPQINKPSFDSPDGIKPSIKIGDQRSFDF
ncbi:MAG: SOS response-associated peptidase [Anaerolineae bacterium]|nr:SOS response-associated peptidase [Anaerolineae bacterium]